MAKGDEIVRYKNRIIKDILCTETDGLSEDIISAIDPKYLDEEIRYDIVYEHVFPYLAIPKTEKETKTYITMAVNMPRVSTKNYFFKNMLITLNVIVHQEKMKMDGSATRADYIASKLNRIFNHNKNYGTVSLEYVSDEESVLSIGNSRFFCRSMRFSCDEINNVRC